MARSTIFTQATITAHDKPPVFNDEQRDTFFLVLPHVRKRLKNMSPERKVQHVLDYGYFGARQQFFEPEQIPTKDVRFVKEMLRIRKKVNLKNIASTSLSRDRAKILGDFGCRPYTQKEKTSLLNHAVKLAARRQPSKSIIYSLVGFCWQNDIENPGFKTLDKLVFESFEVFKKDLLLRIEDESGEADLNLTNLISCVRDDGKLIDNKKFNQAETLAASKENSVQIKCLRQYHSSYLPLIRKLDIDNDVSRHFARRVQYATKRQIKKLEDGPQKTLNILCFVETQYYLRQDYAFDAIKKFVNSAEKSAKKHDLQRNTSSESEIQTSTSIVVDYAKTAESILKVLYEINIDDTISAAERNAKTVHLIKSYLYSSNEKIGDICESITVENDRRKNKIEYYNQLEKSSLSLQGLIMPYLDILEFDDESSNSKITDAIYYLRDNGRNVKKCAPNNFLNKFEKSLIFKEDGSINSSLYKSLLFIAIREAIRSRTLCLSFSYRYQAEMKDTITRQDFFTNRDRYLKDAGMEDFSDVMMFLSELERKNKDLFSLVNKNRDENRNPYLTFTNKNVWSIETPKTDFDTSKFISHFFGESESTSLSNIIREIDEYTRFSDAFKKSHITNETVQTSKPLIYALLTALGCNIGIGKLAGSSGGKICASRLKSVDDTVGSIENLNECNSIIVDKIQSLKLPNIHKAKENITHTSSDGKKITVNVYSLIANLSFKYFGREKGVVINSFLDEKGTFPVMNICPSTDREAAYMLDGIIGMSELFKGDHTHSTDTHGVTEAIFGAALFTKVNIAPRIRNVGKQTLYGFRSKDVKKKNGKTIAPNMKADTKIIIDKWEDILRIMVSIKLGKCSAVQVFSHMSSSEKQSDIYKAFKALGGILKTNHILRYYDDLEFRQQIQKRLSLGEHAQKFKGAIFFGRNGKFQVGEPEEMQRVAMCTTILQNCIVLWNYIILTEAVINSDKSEQEHIIESISRGSVLSWSHVSMLGLYFFDGKYAKRIKYSYERIQKLHIKKLR